MPKKVPTRGLIVLNVNKMFAAALTPELHRKGFDVLTAPELNPDVPYLEIVHCSDERSSGWVALRSGNDLNRIGVVALFDRIEPEQVRRAVARRASVVAIDTDPADVADIVAQRMLGRVCLPAELTEAIVSHAADRLTDAEKIVLRLAAGGTTVENIAEQLHYSDRHIRRILRSVLAKAGTTSREVAAEYFHVELWQ